ncbi:HAMP domain-containing histidine kinase [Faecalicatena sp. Marseille-Q4148]|nr:HAMP domain-containing histidine kinase [Faecalicatena sp. Marseille-Q4148]
MIGFPILMFAGYLFMMAVVSSITWYPGPLYDFLKWIEMRIELFFILCMMVGYLLMVLWYLRKPFQYLIDVLTGVESIYKEQGEMIELSPDLRDAEMHLNKVKSAVDRNARAAKEAEQRKNDLIVYLAHDLKTPLTSVIGYLTLLRDEQQISEELREKYLSITLEKAERLEDLINEFFEITRFNLSNLTLEKSRVNLTRMLEQLTFEFQPMLDEKHLTCRLDAPRDVMIVCDAGKLQRVFDNLLRNAVNYSYEDEEIVFSVNYAKDQKGMLCITCTNRGVTIPPEKLSRIFEQFYRLDTARTTKSGGAGLGLAIAKEIVELHGGTITAYSAEEVIRFEIQLPCGETGSFGASS